MNNFFSRHWWAVTFSTLLTIFTVFVLLDTFVIPHVVQVVVVQNDTPSTSIAATTTAAATTSTGTTTTSASATASAVSVISSTAAASDGSSVPDSAVISATSYKDANISITITTKRVSGTTVYIADIEVSSIEYLQTAFARNTFGRNITQTTSTIAAANDAILAINGDFCGFRTYGLVIRDGVLYRETSSKSSYDALVIYADGTFKIVDESTTTGAKLIADGALQAFSFGPSLLENGKLTVTASSEVAQSKTSNPRTAIGIVSPLHYIFVVSDGRTDASAGLTLYQLAQVLQGYGCTTAYNLDGGGSSTMVFNGTVVNIPTDGNSLGERKVSDIVYIGY